MFLKLFVINLLGEISPERRFDVLIDVRVVDSLLVVTFAWNLQMSPVAMGASVHFVVRLSACPSVAEKTIV